MFYGRMKIVICSIVMNMALVNKLLIMSEVDMAYLIAENYYYCYRNWKNILILSMNKCNNGVVYHQLLTYQYSGLNVECFKWTVLSSNQIRWQTVVSYVNKHWKNYIQFCNCSIYIGRCGLCVCVCVSIIRFSWNQEIEFHALNELKY